MKTLLLATTLLCGLAHMAAAEPAHVRFCTGPEGGNYDFTGIQVAQQARGSVHVDLIRTKGSMDNLDKIVDGTCDAAIVQSDAHGVYLKQHPGTLLNIERGRVLYPEYAHLVCNKNAGLSKITGLHKGMTVLVGPNGGGSSVTWDSFRLADPKRYDDIAILPIGGKRGLGLVDDGKDATCMLYVAGLAASSMNEADAFAETSGHLTLVPTNDGDVENLKDPKGRKVYEDASIPSGTYPHAFQTRSLMGSSIGAIAASAIVVANVSFIDANDAVYDKFLTTLNHAMPAVLEHVSGGRK